jgi:AcrR family transcriptional regulator
MVGFMIEGTRETDSRRKGERTADRVLDAAENLFAQRGYEATALRDVAMAVSISQPALYKHYASKDDLYRQVLQRALQPLADEMEAAVERPESEGSFHLLTSRIMDVMARHPNVAMLLVRSMLSAPSSRDEIGLQWVHRLADYGRRISLAAGHGLNSDDLALHIAAVFNLMFGYFWAAPLLSNLSDRDPLDPAMVERQKSLLDRFIASLSAQGAERLPAQA